MTDYPFPTDERTRARLPEKGEHIYVPQREDPILIGGLAEVISTIGTGVRAQIMTSNHPEVVYYWKGLRPIQRQLHREFAGREARMPTTEELEAHALEEARKAEDQARRNAEVEEAERVRWAPVSFACANSGLLEAPAFDEGKRSKNWAAIIAIDPCAPGGLSRHWFNRGRGICLYIVPPILRVHSAVEFAADQMSFSGYKRPYRWYGIVTEIADDHVTFEPFPDAMSAVVESRKRTLPSGST